MSAYKDSWKTSKECNYYNSLGRTADCGDSVTASLQNMHYTFWHSRIGGGSGTFYVVCPKCSNQLRIDGSTVPKYVTTSTCKHTGRVWCSSMSNVARHRFPDPADWHVPFGSGAARSRQP